MFGQRELFGRTAGWKCVVYLPVLMALGVGVCLNNAKAVFEAIWGAIRKKPSEFVRTPKYGVTGKSRQSWARATQDASASAATDGSVDEVSTVAPAATNFFTRKRLTLPFVEVIFGGYMAWCIYSAVCNFVWYGDMASLASVPFLLIFAGGYFYVGFGSLHALWKMQNEANEEFAEAAEAAEIAGL
jgi:hypothetical protein